MKNGDMPASAVVPYTITEDVQIDGASEGTTMKQSVAANGLTKREAFAMAAMQGAIGQAAYGHTSYDEIASHCINCADALLEALEEE